MTQDATDKILGSFRRILGEGRALGTGSTAFRQAQVSTPAGRGAEADAAAPGLRRDRLCLAHGMSVESLAEGIWERQCGASAFSAMAPGGILPGVVAGGIGRVRRDGRHCLGLAKRGRGDGEIALGHRVRGSQPHGSGKKKGANAVC
jgi:hypothetical protein